MNHVDPSRKGCHVETHMIQIWTAQRILFFDSLIKFCTKTKLFDHYNLV